MGQKVHPEVFKLSRTAGWDSKFFEKKATNLQSNIHKDLEVKNFIKQFFKKIGFSVHTCKLNYLTHRINIFASYTKNHNLVEGASAHTQINKPKLLYKQETSKLKKAKTFNKFVARKLKKKIFLVFLTDLQYITNKLCFETAFGDNYTPELNSFEKLEGTLKIILTFFLFKNQKVKSLSPTLSQYIFKYIHKIRTTSKNRGQISAVHFFLKILKLSFKKVFKHAVKTIKLVSSIRKTKVCYPFLTLFFKTFSLFFKKNLKITLIFKFLNKKFKNNRKKKRALKKKIATSLRKYTRNAFFKPGVNLIFLASSQKESSEIIASFISTSIKNFKKHKLFLTFMKKGLYALTQRKRRVIKAVAIQLKGRINGNDRARSYVIRFRKTPSVIQIGSRINYSESTAFTPDGTLSVKVWVEYYKLKYKNRTAIKICEPNRKKSSIKKQKKVNLLN